jgi:hypothetical protein
VVLDQDLERLGRDPGVAQVVQAPALRRDRVAQLAELAGLLLELIGQAIDRAAEVHLHIGEALDDALDGIRGGALDDLAGLRLLGRLGRVATCAGPWPKLCSSGAKVLSTSSRDMGVFTLVTGIVSWHVTPTRRAVGRVRAIITAQRARAARRRFTTAAARPGLYQHSSSRGDHAGERLRAGCTCIGSRSARRVPRPMDPRRTAV